MLLDAMRKHSRSFIIYIFFGIIIAVFTVNFGPQSGGCGSSTVAAGAVDGSRISPQQFNYALSASGVLARFANLPESFMARVRGRVMDQLIARELMADDALDMGFRIPDKEINDMIVKGRFVILGQSQPLILDDDGKFDYSRFSRWVRYRWTLTVKKFKEQQRRELLAEKIRRVTRSSVKTSEEEVKQKYVHDNTKVELSYVAFSPQDFRDKVAPTEADLAAFIKEKKKDIGEYYKTNKTAYEKLPAQVKLQAITVKFPSDEKKAEAVAKAEALHKRIAGGEDFGAVAREGSEDEAAPRGGVLGWRNEDSPGLGDKAKDLVAKAKEGAISDVVQEKDSLVIFKVLARRKGDLTLEQAQGEIAEQMYATDKALKLAREAAEQFTKRARAGEKLEEMFTTEGDEDENKATDDEAKAEDAEATARADDAADGAPEAAPVAEKPAKSPLELKATTAFSRSGQHLIPGIGVSRTLSTAAFELKEGVVADKPFEVGEMIYLVAVKKRQEADMGEFTKNKKDLTEQFLDTKAGEALRIYMSSRCKEAVKSGKVIVNAAVMVTPGYVPSKKDAPLPQYSPCSSFEPQSLM